MTNETPVLTLTVVKTPPPSGNFNEVENFLTSIRDKYKDIVFTDESIETAKRIKKEMQLYRISLDKALSAFIKEHYTIPRDILTSRGKEFFALIAEVESNVDAALKNYDQKRIDDLTAVFNIYKDELQEKFKLPPASLDRIIFKKEYYNKTAKEADTVKDLEEQFEELKRIADASSANEKLITTLCDGDPRLSSSHWINMLSYRESSAVIEELMAEKERLTSLEEDAKPSGEKMVLGLPNNFNFTKTSSGGVKRMTLEITYPAACVDALNQLFKHLKQYGVKTKQLKARESYVD
jgi:hypothetical protein